MKLYNTQSRVGINSRFGIVAAALVIGSVGLQVLVASPAAATNKMVVATMTDTPGRYVPEDLKISVDTTVEWKNTGKTLHDVSTVVGDAHNKDDVHLSLNAKPFDSGIPHEKDGMIGHIDVTK